MTEDRPSRDSAYFDRWYADMEASPTKDRIQRRHLGLPEDLAPGGVLAWAALDDLAAALRVDAGALLVDVACGRGGYGIELAVRGGARLIGVDFSAVALGWARRIAARRLPAGRSEFRVGTLTATGLPTASADAIVCTDSVQFAEPPLAALREFRRVLVPGGRLALTTWQPTTPGDPRPGPRLRHLDLRRDLEAAGFLDVVVEDRPQWYAAERAVHEEAVATPNDGSDLALASLQREARRSLETFDALHRVIASATGPTAA